MKIKSGRGHLRYRRRDNFKKSVKVIQGLLAGVTGKVAPALTLYNFSQYNPPDAMGETCGEGADRQTAAVCPASSATLLEVSHCAKRSRDGRFRASGMYCTQAPYNRR